MLSKKVTNQLIIAIFAFAANATASADEPKSAQSKPNTIPYNLHEEADKTDSFAVGLDSSEEEQDEELEELHQLEKTPAISK